MPREKTFRLFPVATADELKAVGKVFVEMVVIGDGCWSWLGPSSDGGEGYPTMPSSEMTRRLGLVRASRASWVLHYGHLNSGKTLVCHHCDNPWCVRPDHLFLGTQLQNMRDAQIKGRLRRGCCTRFCETDD